MSGFEQRDGGSTASSVPASTGGVKGFSVLVFEESGGYNSRFGTWCAGFSIGVSYKDYANSVQIDKML